jgi:hypothetical protein
VPVGYQLGTSLLSGIVLLYLTTVAAAAAGFWYGVRSDQKKNIQGNELWIIKEVITRNFERTHINHHGQPATGSFFHTHTQSPRTRCLELHTRSGDQ